MSGVTEVVLQIRTRGSKGEVTTGLSAAVGVPFVFVIVAVVIHRQLQRTWG